MPRRAGAGRHFINLARFKDEDLPAGKEWFTVPEICALTGAHRNTVESQLRAGRLKAKRLSGVWRVYRESLISNDDAKVLTDFNIEKGGET